MRRRLSDMMLKNLKYTDGRAYHVMDEFVGGFGIRVGKGHKSFILISRCGGHSPNPVKIVIGRYPEISLKDAREEAVRLKLLARQGLDPRKERRNPRQRIADKFAFFADNGIEPVCYLYRHYDYKGDLLYVGISLNAIKRQSGHFKHSDWSATIYQILIEPFATREEALEAELTAIAAEYPKFNSVNNDHEHVLKQIKGFETRREAPTFKGRIGLFDALDRQEG